MNTAKYMIKSLIFLAFFFLLSALTLNAQVEIQKEVRVVKPYTPTLSDANKINLLPEFNDTIRVNPDYGYMIYPQRYETDYKIEPIKPAKMVAQPIAKLYKSQLSLGAGNYNTPYMELTINQLRSKTTQLGFYFNHLSSTGKIKLDNDKKVNAGYNDNLLKLYGKKIFNSSVLEADIKGGYNLVHYYGYNTEIDTILNLRDIEQKIYTAEGGLKFYSTYSDSAHFNYKTAINYGVVYDLFKNTEQNVNFDISANKKFNGQVAGADIKLRYFNTSFSDTINYFLVDVNPYYSKSTEEWKFIVGLNLDVDPSWDKSVNIYPRASFEFSIVPNVLIPYIGIDGYREVNNYRKIIFENPFISPGTSFKNTNHTMIFYAGLKGRYSNKVAFNLKGGYDKIDDMYFFRNDSSNVLRNQFIVDYDNASIQSLMAEISWQQSEKLQFLLKGSYFNYQMSNLEHPWHKPAFQASLSADYNLRDKIILGTDLFYTGKRYAPGTNGTINELKGYPDLNLSVDYRYTKTLAFFLRFNNLSATRYNIWNQYPSQRFQFLAGFSYAL